MMRSSILGASTMLNVLIQHLPLQSLSWTKIWKAFRALDPSISSTFNVSDLARYCPLAEIVMPHTPPVLSSKVNERPLSAPPVLSPPRHEYVESVLSELINAAGDKVDRKFLVHWQGRPTSDDSWISEDTLRWLRPELIQLIEEVLHTNSTKPSSSHPGRMMGDHPDDPTLFLEDRISVRLQPRREARADTREPNFKYPA